MLRSVPTMASFTLEGYTQQECWVLRPKFRPSSDAPSPIPFNDRPPSASASPGLVVSAMPTGVSTEVPTGVPTEAPTRAPSEAEATVLMRFSGSIEDFGDLRLRTLHAAVREFFSDKDHRIAVQVMPSSVVCEVTITGPHPERLARALEYSILAGVFDPLAPDFPVELPYPGVNLNQAMPTYATTIHAITMPCPGANLNDDRHTRLHDSQAS